jgi:hypothetical protein
MTAEELQRELTHVEKQIQTLQRSGRIYFSTSMTFKSKKRILE